jgi:hypothetical protein
MIFLRAHRRVHASTALKASRQFSLQLYTTETKNKQMDGKDSADFDKGDRLGAWIPAGYTIGPREARLTL